MNSLAVNTEEKQSENSVEQKVEFKNLKYRIPNFVLPKISNEVRSEVTKELEIQNKEYKSALKKSQEVKEQLKHPIKDAIKEMIGDSFPPDNSILNSNDHYLTHKNKNFSSTATPVNP